MRSIKLLSFLVLLSLGGGCASIIGSSEAEPTVVYSDIIVEAHFEGPQLHIVSKEQFYCLQDYRHERRYTTYLCKAQRAPNIGIAMFLSTDFLSPMMTTETDASGEASIQIASQQLVEMPYEHSAIYIDCHPDDNDRRCIGSTLKIPSEISAPWVLSRSEESELINWLQAYPDALEAPTVQEALAEVTEANEALAMEYLAEGTRIFENEEIEIAERLNNSEKLIEQCLELRPEHGECGRQLETLHVARASWLVDRMEESLAEDKPLEAAAYMEACHNLSGTHCRDGQLQQEFHSVMEPYRPADVEDLIVVSGEDNIRIYFTLVNSEGQIVRPAGHLQVLVTLNYSDYLIEEENLTSQGYSVADEAHEFFESQTAFVEKSISTDELFYNLPFPSDAIDRLSGQDSPGIKIIFEPFPALEFLELSSVEAFAPIDL